MAVAVVAARGSRWGGLRRAPVAANATPQCFPDHGVPRLCSEDGRQWAGGGKGKGEGGRSFRYSSRPPCLAVAVVWPSRLRGQPREGVAAAAEAVQRCHHCPLEGGLAGGGVGHTAWPPRCVCVDG